MIHERSTGRGVRGRGPRRSRLLDLAAANERETRERETLKLRLAYQWAILHPATADSGVETWDGPSLDVLTSEESLGGDGTPPVAAFTPEPFALKLGMTPAAGAQLIGDALDLRHRLPLLWKRVLRLEVPAWQARRVAQQTHRLPLIGARWVDERLAARTDGSVGPVITDRLVALAVAKYDPEEQEEREAAATAASDVTLTHPDPTRYAGTSDLTASGDTFTLQAFHDLVCAIAHQLFLDGDTDPLGVRKIKAIGLITALVTRHEAPLDLRPCLGTARTEAAGKIKLYVLVDAHDLDVDADGGAAFATGTVEKLGAATMAKLRQWVGHSQVDIQPVLNMQRRDAVDQHDPPPWMEELVELRDGHCVFPAAASTPSPATRTTWWPTSRSRKADHPDKPTPTLSPACAGDTTAPRQHGSGGMPARPKATTSGTARTAPPTSSPKQVPTASDHGNGRVPVRGCSSVGFADTVPPRGSRQIRLQRQHTLLANFRQGTLGWLLGSPTPNPAGGRDRIRARRRSPARDARDCSCGLRPRSRRVSCPGSPPRTGARR